MGDKTIKNVENLQFEPSSIFTLRIEFPLKASPTTTSSLRTIMRLYHLTTTAPLAGSTLASGSFTGSKRQEIVVASGTHLHLYRRGKTSNLLAIASTPVYATVRSLGVFRLPGTSRDFLAVTSDAGAISVLRLEDTGFHGIVNETFGRTGMRRTVPGEYLACDPYGRALMVAAVERQKFVYQLIRGEHAEVQLSSPLEAHRSHSATHALAALDVGYENPMFATLEQSYEKDARKCLVYYELDLGLNHVLRKHSAPVHEDSYLLLAVPGDEIGPGGVLVCEPGVVSYRHLTEEDEQHNLLTESGINGTDGKKRPKRIKATIPYREDDVQHKERMIVSGALVKHKSKKGNVSKKGAMFFFMLCTELGDLIRLELIWDSSIGATEIQLTYFDTLPAPALDIRLLRAGYLFALMEGGDSLFFRFNRSNVPKNDPSGGYSTSHPITDSNDDVNMTEAGSISFTPRKKLSYLSLVDRLPSFGPILGMHAGDFTGEGASQLVLASGRGAGGSAIRVLRHGLQVEDRIAALALQGSANAVFSCRDKLDDDVHKLIIVSSIGMTNIMRVEEDSIVEVTSKFGFHCNSSTLCAEQMGLDSFVQVHPHGVRFVPHGKPELRTEWKPPQGVRIVMGAANVAQVIIALSNGDVVYFEINDADALTPIERLDSVLALAGDNLDVNVGAADAEARPSLALPSVPIGKTRSQFFAVGDGANAKVMLYRIDRDGNPQRVSLHLAPAPVSSLAIVDFGEISSEILRSTQSSEQVTPNPPLLTLFIGTRHGALVRLNIDYTTGALAEKRSSFLGPAIVNVKPLVIEGVPTCLAMAARTWIYFPRGGAVSVTPLCTSPFRFAAQFDTSDAPGFIAVTGKKLRMLFFPKIEAIVGAAASSLGTTPATSVLNVSWLCTKSEMHATPRRIVPVFSLPKGGGGYGEAPKLGATGVDLAIVQGHSVRKMEDIKGMDLFAVIESDNRAKFVESEEQRQKENGVAEKELKNEDSVAKEANGVRKVTKRARVISANDGDWAAQIRLVSVRHVQNIDDDDFDEEHGLSNRGLNESYESEATITRDIFQLNSNECALCAVASRTMSEEVENSHIVVSVSRNLSVNATGRSSKKRVIENLSHELWVFLVDRRDEKLRLVHKTKVEDPVYAMVPFRDMVAVGVGKALRLYALGKKRLLRKGELRSLARSGICALATTGGDRLFVGDVQHSVSVCDFSGGTTGTLTLVARDIVSRWTTSIAALDYRTVAIGDKFGNLCVLRCAAQRETPTFDTLETLAAIHVGAAISRVAFDGVSIRYSTMHGAMGALTAFETDSEHTVVRGVERWCARELSICGRDHTAWRSTFYPVKNVVDGDLAEKVLGMDAEKRAKIAKQVARPLADIVRVMDELRWKIESR